MANIFCRAAETSLSIPGVILSKYSITVTSDPNLDQTEPNSRPIYPPPTTTSLLGTSLNESASVDEIILLPVISTPGIDVGIDPVAITIFLASISLLSPSFKLIEILLFSIICASP